MVLGQSILCACGMRKVPLKYTSVFRMISWTSSHRHRRYDSPYRCTALLKMIYNQQPMLSLCRCVTLPSPAALSATPCHGGTLLSCPPSTVALAPCPLSLWHPAPYCCSTTPPVAVAPCGPLSPHQLPLSLSQRVLSHEEDSSLLKAYIAEWGKFFTQCNYLPKPFGQLEMTLLGKPHNTIQRNQGEESIVRKVDTSHFSAHDC